MKATFPHNVVRSTRHSLLEQCIRDTQRRAHYLNGACFVPHQVGMIRFPFHLPPKAYQSPAVGRGPPPPPLPFPSLTSKLFIIINNQVSSFKEAPVKRV